MAGQLSRFASARTTPARRAALVLLTLAVIGVHGCVTRGVAERMSDFNQTQAAAPRMEVAYVREMELATPPPAAAPAAPPAAAAPARPAPKPKPPKKAASAPEALAKERALAAERAARAAEAARAAAEAQARAQAERDAEQAQVTAQEAQAELLAQAAAAAAAASAAASQSANEATSPAAAASAAPAASAALAAAGAGAGAASGAAAFEWPVSTRVSYQLTGNYRGEVKGSAQVEWIREGNHYQVHLDFLVGPSFAPVVQRRMTSDGQIAPEGLVPRRYDEETKVLMGAWRRRTIGFEPDAVLLPNGQRRPRIPGVQDTASQFVQLTYLFSTNPGLLRVGGTVDIPLALAHKVDVWTYDIVAEETLYTSFGELQAFHLKPRRPPDAGANTLSVEIWFAPQLRYLPARLYVTQDAQTYADLMIDRKPELAGR